MDWIEIGDEIEKVNRQQLVVIAEFMEGVNIVIRSYVGTFGEIKNFRQDELHNHYTHYMLVNKPKKS